eukprot:scaffold2864_cov18-Tisochrysis_lutea.AAC.1
MDRRRLERSPPPRRGRMPPPFYDVPPPPRYRSRSPVYKRHRRGDDPGWTCLLLLGLKPEGGRMDAMETRARLSTCVCMCQHSQAFVCLCKAQIDEPKGFICNFAWHGCSWLQHQLLHLDIALRLEQPHVPLLVDIARCVRVWYNVCLPLAACMAFQQQHEAADAPCATTEVRLLGCYNSTSSQTSHFGDPVHGKQHLQDWASQPTSCQTSRVVDNPTKERSATASPSGHVHGLGASYMQKSNHANPMALLPLRMPACDAQSIGAYMCAGVFLHKCVCACVCMHTCEISNKAHHKANKLIGCLPLPGLLDAIQRMHLYGSWDAFMALDGLLFVEKLTCVHAHVLQRNSTLLKQVPPSHAAAMATLCTRCGHACLMDSYLLLGDQFWGGGPQPRQRMTGNKADVVETSLRELTLVSCLSHRQPSPPPREQLGPLSFKQFLIDQPAPRIGLLMPDAAACQPSKAAGLCPFKLVTLSAPSWRSIILLEAYAYDLTPEEAQARYRGYLVEYHGSEIKAEFMQTRNDEKWVADAQS